MSLSATSGLVLANHKSNFNPFLSQANKKNLNLFENKKKEEPKTVNPFNVSQEQLNAQIAAKTNYVQSAPTETLGTMAYNGSGAESAGTMASAAGSVSSVSCVA